MLVIKSQTTNWLFTFHERLQSKKYTTKCNLIQTEGIIFTACAERSFLPRILKCKVRKILQKDTTASSQSYTAHGSLRSDKRTNSSLLVWLSSLNSARYKYVHTENVNMLQANLLNKLRMN